MQKKQILEQLIANTDFNTHRSNPTLQQWQAVGRELLTNKQKHELVASRFTDLDTDLVDGETFFKQLDQEKTISVNGPYVKKPN